MERSNGVDKSTRNVVIKKVFYNSSVKLTGSCWIEVKPCHGLHRFGQYWSKQPPGVQCKLTELDGPLKPKHKKLTLLESKIALKKAADDDYNL